LPDLKTMFQLVDLAQERFEQFARVSPGPFLELLQGFFPWPRLVIENAGFAHFHFEHLGQLHQGREVKPRIFGVDPLEKLVVGLGEEMLIEAGKEIRP
jgi:hypothetical protein